MGSSGGILRRRERGGPWSEQLKRAVGFDAHEEIARCVAQRGFEEGLEYDEVDKFVKRVFSSTIDRREIEKVLLVADLLVCRDEDIKTIGGGMSDKDSVTQRLPRQIGCMPNLVAREKSLNAIRHAVVE
jgi:hypothetical protein